MPSPCSLTLRNVCPRSIQQAVLDESLSILLVVLVQSLIQYMSLNGPWYKDRLALLLPPSNCVTLGQLHSNKQTNKLRLRLPPPHSLHQDDLEFLILMVSPPQFWGYRCATTSGFLVVGMKPWASCMLGKNSTNGATGLILHRYF